MRVGEKKGEWEGMEDSLVTRGTGPSCTQLFHIALVMGCRE